MLSTRKWIQISAGLLAVSLVFTAAAADGFVSLFNGKDLTGWTIQGLEKAGPKIGDDGSLVVGGWDYWGVITEKEYGDFTLKFDVKFDKKGNSGLLIHTPKKEIYKKSWEIQLADDDDQHETKITGALFTEKGVFKSPAKKVTKPTGEWNSVEVTYAGKKLTLKINGETVYDNLDMTQFGIDLTDKGHIAFQRNDYKKAAYFKNIEIKEQ
ncbi:MAG: DUF1080 domain-containing protein [bacterium]|nr:DUF1080 domain-containing protein [bacterium]